MAQSKHPKEAAQVPREVELKLLFRPEDRDRLEQCLSLSGAARRQRQVTTYFDTADHRLAAHGIGLRVRKAGARRVQTVKTEDAAAPTAGRGEWEKPVKGDRPDPAAFAGTPVAKLLSDAARLDPLFRTEVNRETRQLTLSDGTRIEAAFDEGWIVAGERKQPLRELELELKDGSAEALYQLALRLHGAVPLSLGTESKFGRGYALTTGAAGGAAKSGAPALRRSWKTETAFRRMLGDALGHLLANVAPTLRDDVEALHQMRVALRRLRTVLVLFKPLIRQEAAEPLDDRLRELGRVLGEVRDWDVFCLDTLPDAAPSAKAGETWRDAVRQAAEARRTAAREEAKVVISAPEFTALMLSLGLALEGDDGLLRRDKAAAQRISLTAPDLLKRAAGKVRRRGRRVAKLEGAALHDLRKAMKKLRYSVDDFGGLYSRKAVEGYLDGCRKLQKVLGRLNDFSVAERQAIGLTTAAPSISRPAAAAFLHWLGRRRKKQHRKLAPAWADFRAATAFWA